MMREVEVIGAFLHEILNCICMLICYCKVTVVSDAACEASSSTEVTVGQNAS